MSEVEYKAMKHTIQSVISLAKKYAPHFTEGSVNLHYYTFFQDLCEILGLDDPQPIEKE